MASPLLVLAGEGAGERHAPDDPASLRLTPTPGDNYRCPVSTPSNPYVQRHSRIRRSKPLQESYSQAPSSCNRSHKSVRTMGGGRQSRNTALTDKSWSLKTYSGPRYYFVDKQGDRQDAKLTNSCWLKALCAQPVDEILNKYRRKSDVRRTKVIWAKTFTTPGERSLLDVWERNSCSTSFSVTGGGYKRSQKTRSALVGGARVKSGEGSLLGLRTAMSEPPMGRSQQCEVGSPGRDSITPGPPSGRENPAVVVRGKPPASSSVMGAATAAAAETTMTPWATQQQHQHQPPRIKGFLLEEQSPREGSRVVTFTTQYFLPKDGSKSSIYSRTVTGPEQLPRLSNGHKVVSMLYNSHYYQNTSSHSDHPTPESSPRHPRSPSPIQEVEDAWDGNEDAML